MKQNAIILLILTGLLSLTGCVDYGVDYIYNVENQLDKAIIVHIETDLGAQDITVNASSTKEIYRKSELCEKYFVPEREPVPFDVIKIYHDQNIEIQEDFSRSDYWSFYGTFYEGKYVLAINAWMLK